jgi:hypothetical protein
MIISAATHTVRYDRVDIIPFFLCPKVSTYKVLGLCCITECLIFYIPKPRKCHFSKRRAVFDYTMKEQQWI